MILPFLDRLVQIFLTAVVLAHSPSILSFARVFSIFEEASYKATERHSVYCMFFKLRFDERIYFFLELIEFIKYFDLRSNGPHFFFDISQMIITVVILSNKVFVVGSLVAIRTLVWSSHYQ